MFTTDIALKVDPTYGPISKRFQRASGRAERSICQSLVQADAPRYGTRHKVLGTASCAGAIVPRSNSSVDHPLIGDADIAALKGKLLASGLTVPQFWYQPRGNQHRHSVEAISVVAPMVPRILPRPTERPGRSTILPSWQKS